jgi:hypothetical protein
LEAEPIIDSFVEHYLSKMGDQVHVERNIFDYGVGFPEDGVILYRFSEDQIASNFLLKGVSTKYVIYKIMDPYP